MSTATATKAKPFTKEAGNGLPVVWFRDLKQTTPGLPAFVTAVHGDNGVISVAYLTRNGRTIFTKENVRHRDDPFHDKRPGHAKEYGVWDYSPYYTPYMMRLAEEIKKVFPDLNDFTAALHGLKALNTVPGETTAAGRKKKSE